jgi:hypothetical protein
MEPVDVRKRLRKPRSDVPENVTSADPMNVALAMNGDGHEIGWIGSPRQIELVLNSIRTTG